MIFFKHRVVLSLAITLSLGALDSAVLATTVRTVALSGLPAPGTSSGVNFTSFSNPALSASGHTAFHAFLAGSGVDNTNNVGIWSEGAGALELTAREGSQAADLPSGVNYGTSFGTRLINAAGQVAFRTNLTGAGVNITNDGGIWSEGSGAIRLVAREGGQAAGTPSGVNYSSFGFDSPRLNATGQTAFYAALVGSGVNGTNNSGIWSEGSGVLDLVARKGSQAPGTPSDVNYSDFRSPVLNGAGQTAFFAKLTGIGVDTTNDSGIWSEGSGVLELLAREGDQASGAPSGVNYSDLFLSGRAPVLNTAGQIAFRANLIGSGVDATNNSGIWSDSSGVLDLVAREGSQAPGTPSGVSFFNLNEPLINAGGQTAFSASLAGNGVDSKTSLGIWSEGSGSLELVARTGGQAPGTPDGVYFSSLYSMSLNAAGQTAFLSFLTGSGIGAANNSGIWAADVNGTLQLIARKGDQLEVAPSDFRTINFLSFIATTEEVGTGNEDSRPGGFNDLGQLAFSASFTDGSSGVFVSDLVLNDGVLPGDFNKDGIVDGADYVMWRKTDGNNQAGYNIWRANLGRSTLGGDSIDAVPEPTGLVLLGLGALGVARLRKRVVE